MLSPHLLLQLAARCAVVSPSERPYSLIVVNSYCSQILREVPVGAEPLHAVVGQSELVVVAWRVAEPEGGGRGGGQLVGLVGTGAGAGAGAGAGRGVGNGEVKAEEVFRWSRWVGEDDVGSSEGGSGNGSGRGSGSGSGRKKRGLHVLDCLDKFVEREQLNSEETLYCSACKQHLAPVKKMDLWSVPEVLIVHLKRFHYAPGQYFVHREKINEVGILCAQTLLVFWLRCLL